MFANRFYIGCEADDRSVAWAFNRKINPFGTAIRAMFGSDVGHWDVIDVGDVVVEAEELVDDDLITSQDFKEFMFWNPVELHARVNPDFFRARGSRPTSSNSSRVADPDIPSTPVIAGPQDEPSAGRHDASLREVLRGRPFRIYLIGHFISLCGNAMQQVGIAWLVLELTDSGAALGAVVFVNYLPAFLIAPWGGLIADRVDRRRAVLCSQFLLGTTAVLLAAIVLADIETLWMVFAIAFVNGAVMVVDMPLRQVFVHELVSDEGLHRAISLTTSIGHAARTIGPAAAGLTIVWVGIGVVFLINAVTFAAVITSVLLIRRSELHLVPHLSKGPGQIVEGLRVISSSSLLRVTFLVMFVVGALGFSFNVILPLLASVSFGGGADAYGWLAASMGVGSVAGALVSGVLPRPGSRRLGMTSAVFGVSAVLLAAMPNLVSATLAAAFYGAGNVLFVSTCNIGVQLTVPPSARGRVMAFFGVVFWGSMAIGGPIAGFLSDRWGPRAYLAVSGVLMVAVGAAVALLTRITATPRVVVVHTATASSTGHSHGAD